MRVTKLFLATTAMATMFVAQSAFAAEGDNNGEIIVTARKQQESILKVPVVANVIAPETMQTYQINNLQDITTKIPGLVSGNAVLAIGEQMSLRGVGSNSLDQGVDQSVSLNIDGLQLTHGLAYRAASFDVSQVEVLKGPQALYFGKNSTAGVISFRTNDPGDKLELIGRAGYEFESREWRGEAIVSGPLSDTAGIRVAALYSNSQGIYKNTAVPQPNTGAQAPKYDRLGGGESYLIRATFLWKPSDNFTARLKANFAADSNRQGGSNQLAQCADGVGTVPGLPVPWGFYAPNEDCKYDKNVNFIDADPAAFPGIRNNGVPFLKLNQNFGTLELNYDLNPELSLTSVTGFYKAHADTMINGTFTGYAGPAITADNIFNRREWTQELRLESDFNKPINFSFGGFYQNAEISNDFTLGGNTKFGLPGTLVKGISTIDVESISVFGQLRWKASEQIELAGGVRWQNETRDLTVFNRLTNARTVLAPGTDQISSKNWSPEFTLTYTPSDTLTIFGAFKQAYKSGSFNIVIPGNTGENKRFGDEKVQGGEIGIKSRLLDRALSLDVAGYYYRYSGLQTGVNEPAQGGLPVLRTVNAGKAEIYGIDFDIRYRPPSIEGLTLNLAGAWNRTKFLELNNVPCWGGQLVSQGCNQFWAPFPPTGTPSAQYTQGNPAPGAIVNPTGANALLGRYTSQNLTGIPFVRAPEWQINFGFTYEKEIGNGMRLVFGNDNQYQSSYLTILGDDTVRPITRMAGVVRVDLSLTLFGKDDRWSIGIYGKNLGDKLRPGYCSSYNAAGGSIFTAPVAGTTARNAAGVDEIGCSFANGRAIGIAAGFKY